MYLNYLDFEQSIAELQDKINELKQLESSSEVNIDEEVARLEKKSEQLTRSIFSNLSTMQIVRLARHPQRPYTWDYLDMIFNDFDELCGDRQFSKGYSIIGGTARLNEQPVMVIGHQKGRKTQDKLKHNFGMPSPEDYRRTQRLFQMAEKFRLPLIMLVDTAGAYPGVGAEEHNQSYAIAKNLFDLSQLATPIITVVTGEGGSGGALALSVADRIAMLEYTIYSVISPEGCASILWKNTDKASEAAETLGVTASKVKKQGLIDHIIEEPLGGAHRCPETMAASIKSYLEQELQQLQEHSTESLVQQRYQRLMDYGVN